MKPKTTLPPFVADPLRVFIEGDIYERAAAEALQFWDWWHGSDEGLGPEGVAIIAGMSESQARAILTRMRKKGWVEAQSGRRDLGEKTSYQLTVPKITYKEAYKIMTVRLSGSETVPLPDSDTVERSATTKRDAPQEVAERILRDQTLRPKTNKAAHAAGSPDSDQKPNSKELQKAARRERDAVLQAHAVWWQARYSKSSSPVGIGDSALADKLVASGLKASTMADLLRAWPAMATDYTQREAFSFRCFVGDYTKLLGKAQPASCAHPEESTTWDKPFRDGTQAGVCKSCGAHVHRQVEQAA